MSIEAMKLALEALEYDSRPKPEYGINSAITILRQAIEKAEKKEPVLLQVNGLPPFNNPPNVVIDSAFHVSDWAERNGWNNWRIGNCCSASYTHPQRKREWVGLTDEEKRQILLDDRIDWINAIEAKLREKNGC